MQKSCCCFLLGFVMFFEDKLCILNATKAFPFFFSVVGVAFCFFCIWYICFPLLAACLFLCVCFCLFFFFFALNLFPTSFGFGFLFVLV